MITLPYVEDIKICYVGEGDIRIREAVYGDLPLI